MTILHMKCTCTKTGMLAFGQACLSYKNLSYLEIARAYGLANRIEKL